MFIICIDKLSCLGKEYLITIFRLFKLQRHWNRGINSDAVLRLAGKAPLGLPGGLRGRGGSVDRGRGRTRGSGGFHYTRGLSYDETSEGVKDGALERGFSRGGRGYDRSQVRILEVKILKLKMGLVIVLFYG